MRGRSGKCKILSKHGLEYWFQMIIQNSTSLSDSANNIAISTDFCYLLLNQKYLRSKDNRSSLLTNADQEAASPNQDCLCFLSL